MGLYSRLFNYTHVSWDWCTAPKGTSMLYTPSIAGNYEVRLYSGSSAEDKELMVIEIEVE